MNAPSYNYVMVIDIWDSHHNVGYAFVTNIINVMHNEIFATQKEEMGNFKFHNYLLLMCIILYKNIGHTSLDFIKGIGVNGENLCM